jgi:hypothetical protein
LDDDTQHSPCDQAPQLGTAAGGNIRGGSCSWDWDALALQQLQHASCVCTSSAIQQTQGHVISHTLCDAVLCCVCSGPREDATRIGSAGVVRRQAVDISPLRRVNQAIWLLTTGEDNLGRQGGRAANDYGRSGCERLWAEWGEECGCEGQAVGKGMDDWR